MDYPQLKLTLEQMLPHQVQFSAYTAIVADIWCKLHCIGLYQIIAGELFVNPEDNNLRGYTIHFELDRDVTNFKLECLN